ncbi:MAG TPA: hypothetical protein VFV78_12745 [Vicinamibacterales bacterium]|nr:hypothetical protein [Vicinamibacterales bacterium]
MTSRCLLRAIAPALAALVVTGPMAASPSPPDLPALLDEYAAGGDRAIRRVELLGDDTAIEMRLDWATLGRAWIERDASDRPRRLFVAAAFALETEAILVERGLWSRSASRKIKEKGKESTVRCNGACVISWARGLFVERGAPDAAEHAWWIASVALAQGVRDTRFLLPPPAPSATESNLAIAARLGQVPNTTTLGHLAAALTRFPNDPQFRLAKVVAASARFEITTDAAPRSPGTGNGTSDMALPNIVVISRASGAAPAVPVRPTSAQVNRARYAELPGILSDFEAIAGDATAGIGVRTEARIRLGYLHWATGDSARALAALTLAAESAPSADLRYLADYLAGVAHESLGDAAAATAAYEAALTARPHSQSASIKLAVLRQLHGDAAGAQAIAQETLDRRPNDADPWRLFLYGHYPQLPALLAEIRLQVPR